MTLDDQRGLYNLAQEWFICLPANKKAEMQDLNKHMLITLSEWLFRMVLYLMQTPESLTLLHERGQNGAGRPRVTGHA